MIEISSIDRARKDIRVRADGPITANDMLAHLQQEEELKILPFKELIDARGARPDFSPAHLRSVVAAVRRLAAETGLGNTAIIVDSELAYGMLRMLEILVEDVCTIRPFRSHEKAEQWLADCNAA